MHKIICPKCGATCLIKSGHTAKGTQRYECKMCGTRSAGQETRVDFTNPDNIKCRHCGSTNIKKKGFTRIGKQLYYCRDCNRKFIPENEARFLRKDEKIIILRYCKMLKLPVSQVAKHLHRSEHTVQKFLNDYSSLR